MKKFRNLLVRAIAVSGFFWSATSFALSSNAGPTEFDGAWGTGHQGQAFTPAENADPDPMGTSIAYLQQLEFTRGGTIDSNVGDIETYVDIYSPTGSTVATSTLIGSSIGAVDTTDTMDGAVYAFQFDNVALVASTTYIAVFRNSTNTTVLLNLRQSYEPTVAINIGGPYDYVGGGAIFEYDISGWAGDTNLDFTALYSNVAPISTSAFVSGVTQIFGEWGSGMQGQAFVPRINAVPNPIGTPTSVYLQNMQFTLGGLDNHPGDAATTLDIYLPGGTIATSTLIGSSSNTVDTINAAGDAEDTFGNPPIMYTFEFTDLELFYNTTYMAIFKNSSGAVISLNIEQGFEGNDLFPGAVPMTVGGGGVFDYDAFGWAEETNADFSATFATSAGSEVNVPMMGWLGLILLSSGLLVIGRIVRRVR